MSGQVNYYRVERLVAEGDRALMGAALGQLMLLPNVTDYFEPINPSRLHTTLFYSREFAKIARIQDDTAPINLLPPATWKGALENVVDRFVGTADETRARVTGFMPLIDAQTENDGWKSFALSLRNGQIERERGHMTTIANKLAKKNLALREGHDFKHHISLGYISPDYDPRFMKRAQQVFASGFVLLEPVEVRGTSAERIEASRKSEQR
jgi:hypothetical protein